MEIIWFCLVAFMIAGYVVLDGFDLGAGAIHLFVARSNEERRQVLRSIGPVWDGNEVWLIAGGGTLYFAFPGLYSSSFSGFYLPLMVVLWLLILRGISIELRNHLDTPTWTPFWDVVFAGSSALLAIFFGAALGNVVRGVPLMHGEHFFLPLWVDFTLGPDTGILDWFTVLVGVLAFATLVLHGAAWVALKTEGPVQTRSHAIVRRAVWAVLPLTVAVTLVTFRIQPQVPEQFAAHPWGYVFPAIAIVGLAGVAVMRHDWKIFLASCLFIIGMLSSVAFGLFPYVLPSNVNRAAGLTIYNTAAAEYGLKVGLMWWIPGMLLATAYSVYVYRSFAGKLRVEGERY